MRLATIWQNAMARPAPGLTVAPDEPIDYDQLEEYLRALAHGRRLELLHILQSPHALADIRITPGKSRAGERPDRVASRQAVQKHLETLQEIGVVVAAEPADGRGKEFVVDRQRVFQVLEELRRVGTITAGAFVSRDATVAAGEAPEARHAPGPKLVLVHGFIEGKVFPLQAARPVGKARGPPASDATRSWVIGRKAGVAVCLDYDPFVSLVNSEVAAAGDGFQVRDLGVSRNGTWLNWRRVGTEPMPLSPGDVIGVGRSLLAFQPQ